METTPQKIMELYNYMEEKLEEMELTFDEYSVLYKAFRTKIPVAPEEKKEEAPAPFPWVKYAGHGKYS